MKTARLTRGEAAAVMAIPGRQPSPEKAAELRAAIGEQVVITAKFAGREIQFAGKLVSVTQFEAVIAADTGLTTAIPLSKIDRWL